MQNGGPQNAEMEDLMAGPAEVEFAWCASLWAPDHVDHGTLDVDVATKGVDEARVGRDVRVHEGEHDKHGRRGDTQDYIHNASNFLVLGLIELRDQSHYEAAKAGNS